MLDESNSGRVYKVVLFGVTGSGKSSIVNLLADKSVAEVSPGVEICTKRVRWFPVSVGEKKYRLWDTTGFNQAEAQGINLLSPYEQAHAVLQNFQDGVDLILLCARRDGINDSLSNLYWLLDSFFFDGRAQIALVLTNFDSSDEGWWGRNRHLIAQNCGIKDLPYACITAVRRESSQPDAFYDQSKRVLRELLREYATAPTRLSLDLSSDIARRDAAGRLKDHCQLNILDAEKLVRHLRFPRRPFHAILFGEAGVGKSSIINLILGEPKAKVSSKLGSCTLESCCYEVDAGLHKFLVWNTMGFSGTLGGKDVTLKAFKGAAGLVRDLHARGGVDLLIFCTKSGRLSASEFNSFKLFQEVLCKREIPVAFIITHLEAYDPMEDWWEEHGEELVKSCEMRMSAVAGHACITSGLDRLKQCNSEKLSLSRQSVLTMLEDSVSYGNASNELGMWVTSPLKKVAEIVRAGSPGRKKVSVKDLMGCGLNKEQAEEVLTVFNLSG